MIVELPETTTSALGRRLVDLRTEHGALALGRVLTLVVVTDRDGCEGALGATVEASFMHPCRIIALVRGGRRGRPRLDGQIRVGGDAGAAEIIVARLSGELVDHGASVVTPLLLPDSPIVGWWPGAAPPDTARDPIGRLCRRRITDMAVARAPAAELGRRADAYRPGDTDLAWSRITRWRAVLAAALDQPPFDAVTGVTVTGGSDSPSTDLLAAWLAERLRVTAVRERTAAGSGLLRVVLDRPSGPLTLDRPLGRATATLTHPLQPERTVAMARRSDAECLADELRHLDADEIYHAALRRGLPRVAPATVRRRRQGHHASG